MHVFYGVANDGTISVNCKFYININYLLQISVNQLFDIDLFFIVEKYFDVT